MKKILIPLDGSAYGKSALREGKKFAAALGFSVVLLHVIPLSVYPMNDAHKFKEDLNFKYQDSEISTTPEILLKEAKEFFADMADRVETVLMDGEPADKILEYLESHEIDMIIMGSHGMSEPTLKQLFVGSVTAKIINAAKQPVLVVKQSMD